MPRGTAVFPVVVIFLACAAPVEFQRADIALLEHGGPAAIAYVPSGPPEIFCPTDEGRQLWEYPGSGDARPPPRGPALLLASSAAGPARLASTGGIWESWVEDWTRTIRVPPSDPAQVTARRFLELAPGMAARPAWIGPVVEVASPDVAGLRERFGSRPVLVFQVSRWDLVGCFYTWLPWFDVRATLVDAASGRVLWRQSCGEAPGGQRPNPAWPSELDAGGRELYSRIIEGRALQCARTLAALLEPSRAEKQPITPAGDLVLGF